MALSPFQQKNKTIWEQERKSIQVGRKFTLHRVFRNAGFTAGQMRAAGRCFRRPLECGIIDGAVLLYNTTTTGKRLPVITTERHLHYKRVRAKRRAL